MKRSKKTAGFTLIELLVVVVILGILVTIVGVNVLKHPDRARVVAAATQIAFLKQGLSIYYIHHGNYPTTLQALITPPAGDAAGRWDGPYLDPAKIPKDPWDHEYVYRLPGSGGADYDIICYGKDGASGGDGYDKDITNHNLDELR
ncbi:Type II secretion system protein G [subsurface metagenome]